ncbi:adenosine kinase [Actinomycetospora endophytica]|uniref:Adenosine kinase n=1 Tax=Actinomycetospora endophytica TaxID=2291215 RepID=A0ABS8PE30_9PSEU|nr:adenosine kinase [Actinomycetospora endophytica]MCD2196512.1 adenosine kinase [Actinomycetospora endophytica]
MDVLGIGNAIVDVLTQTDDDTITAFDLPKGGMTLVDQEQAETLYAKAGETTERSGGSVANSIAIAAALGADSGYVGKVHDDQLGASFTRSIRSHGVTFTTPASTAGPSTARCLVLVTPDGERTMGTYLGACTALGPDDIEQDDVAGSAVTLIEGYLADTEHARETIGKIVDATAKSEAKVALTLSDAGCVERHREYFRELAAANVEIIIADEDEVAALVGDDGIPSLLRDNGGNCEIVVVTHGAEGSTIYGVGGATYQIDTRPADQLVDTTGAGDAYAGGFLYGLTHGLPLQVAGRIGSVAASHVVAQLGAQPPEDLKAKVAADVPEFR